jgi:hypothetical protein
MSPFALGLHTSEWAHDAQKVQLALVLLSTCHFWCNLHFPCTGCRAEFNPL